MTKNGWALLRLYLPHLVLSSAMVLWEFNFGTFRPGRVSIPLQVYMVVCVSVGGTAVTYTVAAGLQEFFSRRKARRMAVIRDVMES